MLLRSYRLHLWQEARFHHDEVQSHHEAIVGTAALGAVVEHLQRVGDLSLLCLTAQHRIWDIGA